MSAGAQTRKNSQYRADMNDRRRAPTKPWVVITIVATVGKLEQVCPGGLGAIAGHADGLYYSLYADSCCS